MDELTTRGPRGVEPSPVLLGDSRTRKEKGRGRRGERLRSATGKVMDTSWFSHHALGIAS